ncbi:dienelactone hydrolase family protein [Roseomonas marmotae]|uniref:Dienelactone hydrolase family protein n=1 Tax=Roseomonas marmotae TaxID=2768161 RepID=A0ABS3K9C5_9PROT|nr:dienelactone hydrolase family protein [Roseomonas marmotae]MBO1074065.1 dienelactone hydrolase family protein [Roseomonas marmotae]QTI78850.1 dienelactone hydrolase family protein [Roseomonas marmotae]
MQIELTASDGHRFSAWQAGPAGASKALVVVQEIFGVNRHMRHVCEGFANQGFAVICPALFDRAEPGIELGYAQEDMQRGMALRSRVTEKQAMLDIEAAAAALPAGAAKGIIGYCWGGTIAWWGATRSRSFQAAIGYYGGGIAATKAETPHCPVQLHFGGKDKGIPLSDVEAIRAAQPGIEIHVYPGAQHGFSCEERPSYSPTDAMLAEQRSLDFLARHLG